MTPLVESPEQQQLRETVRLIARRYGHRAYVAAARAGGSASELWDELGRGGFLGVNLPVELGGGGAGIAELAIVQEELGASGCPLLMIVVSPAIAGPLLATFGTDEQRSAWVPGLASGELVVAFAMTEPDAGSNSHEIATTATRVTNGWRISGLKYYISGADIADAAIVVARTGTDEATGRGRLSLFIVPLDAAGIERTLIPVEVLTPERQFTVFFDDVIVGDDALIGRVGDGLRQVFHGLNPERILSAAVCCGLGRYTLEQASAYATNREVWGVPIGAHQGIAHPLAEAAIALELAVTMTRQAAALFDAGLDAAVAANIAKYARGRGGGSLCGSGDPSARGQRVGAGVRPGRPVGPRPALSDRARQSGDGVELREPTGVGPSPIVLMEDTRASVVRGHRRGDADEPRPAVESTLACHRRRSLDTCSETSHGGRLRRSSAAAGSRR